MERERGKCEAGWSGAVLSDWKGENGEVCRGGESERRWTRCREIEFFRRRKLLLLLRMVRWFE